MEFDIFAEVEKFEASGQKVKPMTMADMKDVLSLFGVKTTTKMRKPQLEKLMDNIQW